MEVFRLFGSIGVDTSDAVDAIDDVRDHGRRAGDDLNNNTGRKMSAFGAKSAAIMGAIAGAAQAAFSKVISIVTETIGKAVKRVDTLNNSQRVFQNMGFSAQETDAVMKALDKSISGLPTALDSAVSGVQTLAATSGDLSGAQKVYKALNDGILAFGGSTEQVDGAILQLSQRPLDGPLDAETWNSLMENGLTPVLAAIAKDSGVSMGQLKDNFSKGKLTVEDFNKALVKADQDGVGGMASLEKQARDATSGISTGWANMQTAVTRGVAKIIQAVGSENISSAISTIGKGFETALTGISQAITFIEQHKDAFSTMAVAIGTATAAFIAYNLYVKTSAAVTTAYAAVSSYLTLVQSLQAQGLGLLRAAWMALNIVMNASPMGIIITAVAALAAGLIWFFTQTETGRQIFAGFVSFLVSAWNTVATTVTNVWNGIVSFLTTVFTNISTFIGTTMATISTIWNTVWGGISSFFSGVWNAILLILQTVWNAILAYLTLTIGIPLAIINTFLIQPLLAVWNFLWSTISAVFTAVWNGIVAFLTPIINALRTTITNVINAIKATWTTIWNAIKTVFTVVWNAIKAFIVPIINAIKTTITNVFNAIKTTISTIFNAIKTTVSNVWNGIKSVITTVVNTVKTTISNVFNGIKNTVKTVWDAIKSAIETPINKAKDIVKGAIDAIKRFFSFKISWPKIPLPHFDLKPHGWKIADLLKGSIPSLAIDWYAKGGIMTGPTIFGMNGNNPMVGGEAGREAVLPLNRDTLGQIGDGIAMTMDGGKETQLLAAMLEEVRQLREENQQLKVVMDSGELVGAIRKQVDQALQNDAILRQRGVTP